MAYRKRKTGNASEKSTGGKVKSDTTGGTIDKIMHN